MPHLNNGLPEVLRDFETQSFRYNTHARNHKSIGRAEQSNLFLDLMNKSLLNAIQERDAKRVKKLLVDLRTFSRKYLYHDSRDMTLSDMPTLKDGSTLLHEAIKQVGKDENIKGFSSSSLEIVNALIFSNADVNAKDGSGVTPLLLAIAELIRSEKSKVIRIHEKLISILKDEGALVEDLNCGDLPVRVLPVIQEPSEGGDFEEPSEGGDFNDTDCLHAVGKESYYGMTSTPRLLKAVIRNDVKALVEALGSGEDPSKPMIPSKLTMLHMAAWLNCPEIVELLLEVHGVDPHAEDHFGLTPIVIAAAMGYQSCLAAMLEAGADPNRKVQSPNYPCISQPSLRVDYLINMPTPVNTGTTALHEAVKSNSSECVTVLLSYGANANAEDCLGNTPLLVAGAILKTDTGGETSIRTSSYADLLEDTSSAIRKYPLTKQISLSPSESVSFVNSEKEMTSHQSGRLSKDSLDAIEEDKRSRLIQNAEYERIVYLLLDCTENVNHFNSITTSALINAISLGSELVVKILLSAGADPSLKNKYETSAFHETASRGYANLLEDFINHVKKSRPKNLSSSEEALDLVNSLDGNCSTPVHRAAYGGHKDCISVLLKAGADLSKSNVHSLSGIESILLHTHRSRSFLSSLLDSGIHCRPAHKWEGDFVLDLDFNMIAPEGDVRQTAVMNSLLSSTDVPKGTQRDILEHPLVESFYRLKWHKSRIYFVMVIVIHVIFVATLSTFISLEYLNNNEDKKLELAADILRYTHLLTAVFVLLNVLGPSTVHFSYYKRQFETWILGLSACLSIFWAAAGLVKTSEVFAAASASNWGKMLLSFMIPLAWTALMLMIGRFREWGSRALLFGVVLRNVVLTFCVLGLLIIGLSLSFFVQFHSSKPDEFGDPWKSFVNTIVMMTGEYNYAETFEGSDLSGRILFLIFVVVATLVIMNLIIALAVTDAQSLSTQGEWLCLKKKMEFTDALDSILPRIVSHCVLPKKIKFFVDGSEDSGYSIKTRALPSRVVNSLMDAALRNRREKPSLWKESGDVVISFPEMEDCSLELHVIDAQQSKVDEILRSLYSRAGGIRDFVLSSKALPNLGSKVFWVKKFAKKSRRNV